MSNAGWIEIEGVARPPADVTEYSIKRKFYDAFEAHVKQICNEALCGTFGDFHSSIFENPEAMQAFKKQTGNLARASVITSSSDRTNNSGGRFRLKLSASAFDDPSLAFQKLIHVLVSDLFERKISQFDSSIQIEKINLDVLIKPFEDRYRSKSWSKDKIKKAFDLEKDIPLLAFSLKPRSGLRKEDYLYSAEQAWRGGFHIVELDTRDLDVSSEHRRELFKELIKLSVKLSKGEKIKRFSANLSGPSLVIKPVLKELHDIHKELGTDIWVVKVDGNLDGLSTIQSIRSEFWDQEFSSLTQPIITCYPVMKYGLLNYIPGKCFVDMLILSGADIIYPGSKPRFSEMNHIEGENLTRSIEHYENSKFNSGHISEYPMLSVAGGVHVGEIHSTMALLGGDIAFFTGGGLALSKKGIKEAAENFQKASLKAHEFLMRGIWDEKKLNKTFSKFTKVYSETSTVPPQFEYVNPCNFLNKVEMKFEP